MIKFREYIEMRESSNLEEGRLGRLVGAGLVAGLAAFPWAKYTGERSERSAERPTSKQKDDRTDLKKAYDPSFAAHLDSTAEEIEHARGVIERYKAKKNPTQEEKKHLSMWEARKKRLEIKLTETEEYLRKSADKLKWLRSEGDSLTPDQRFEVLSKVSRSLLTPAERMEIGLIP